MNRQQRRNELRLVNKLETKLYTFAEVKAIIQATEESVRQEYETIYPLSIVNALRAEPFTFGKKRLSEVMKLIYGNIEGLKLGTISFDNMASVANSAGINITYRDNVLHIDMSDGDKALTNSKAM